jgi:uncharacterized membrane protein (DUF4010 family)
VRTFFLLGLLSGIAGLLASRDRTLLSAVLLAGPALLIVGAYVVASLQTRDRDGTTEAAALLVLATGGLSGLGEASLAAAVAAVAAMALAEKSRVRDLIARIGETELRAALQFAGLAVVVLPLLPLGPFGPGGAIRPRELWSVVLIFSGINFLGYLARRAAGPERGYGIAGLLGGLVSSTAVTLGFSRQSRLEPEHARGLALGVVAACTVLFARVFIVTAALSMGTARALAPYLIAPAVIGGAIVGYAVWRQPSRTGAGAPAERNPLRLLAAVRMTVAFALVLLVIPLVERLWGSGGVLGSAAILGLTDLDALTYTMARLGETSGDTALAARAIGVGLAANTLAKLGLAMVLGAAPFRRRAAPALSALALGVLAGLVFWR